MIQVYAARFQCTLPLKLFIGLGQNAFNKITVTQYPLIAFLKYPIFAKR